MGMWGTIWAIHIYPHILPHILPHAAHKKNGCFFGIILEGVTAASQGSGYGRCVAPTAEAVDVY